MSICKHWQHGYQYSNGVKRCAGCGAERPRGDNNGTRIRDAICALDDSSKDINVYGPKVVAIFQGAGMDAFNDADNAIGNAIYSFNGKGWMVRRVRNHAEWGKKLFAAANGEKPAVEPLVLDWSAHPEYKPAPAMPTLHIICTSLTDGSKVYDVHVPELRLAAITQGAADALARDIANAIGRYTNEIVCIKEV